MGQKPFARKVHSTQPDDVMRGEETQLLGALNDMTHQSIVCLPGTHSKWVHLTGLQINRFSTAMTGELFSLLRKQSILRHSIGKTDELHLSTFRDAVRRSAAAPEELMTALFEVRAAGLLNPGAVDYAFSTLSGLLLGAEFSSALSSDVEHVVLVGDPELTRIYAAGLEAIGVSSTQKDGAVAAVRGLSSVLGSLKLPSKVSV
ncbi:MAG: 2-dehydro-3-deoxygalactonokinase [Pseudomonadota bacterium]